MNGGGGGVVVVVVQLAGFQELLGINYNRCLLSNGPE